jgi:hypothetical protein
MAARVAAELKKETDVQVEIVRGGLGEFSVHLDDRKVIDTNRLWYPAPSKVVKKIKALLAE